MRVVELVNIQRPYIQQVAVGRLPELSVYGHDYPTKDGSASLLPDYQRLSQRLNTSKLIENSVSVPDRGAWKSPHGDLIQMDTKNILSICGGPSVKFGEDDFREKTRFFHWLWSTSSCKHENWWINQS
uniref:Uncharacterized protein n=1 Tax=Quercus lobata TaxID=97700 RepID=A0A7N2N0I2_QUELO